MPTILSAESSLLIRCHMLRISPDILTQFRTDLRKKAVPCSICADDRRRWRYHCRFEIRGDPYSAGWRSVAVSGLKIRRRLLTDLVNNAILRDMKNTKNGKETPTDVHSDAAASQLGTVFRSERVSRGWTLERLARKLQVTKGYLSRLEGGKARPAAKMIERLAKTWQIDPAPLLILAGQVPADVREIQIGRAWGRERV